MESSEQASSEQGQGDVASQASLPASVVDTTILHPLEHEWGFWYDRRRDNGRRTKGERDHYENNLKELGTFATVEDFWRYYNHIVPPSHLENNANYHLFKSGIKPMWEDPANAKGGKWIVVIKKDTRKLDKYWENLVLAMIGETIDEATGEICGGVISRRKAGDKISLWNRSDDKDAILNIGQRMKDALGIKERLVYQNHADCMRSGASYSNPDRYVL